MLDKFYVQCRNCKYCKPELPDWSTGYGMCLLNPTWMEVDTDKHGCYSGHIDFDRRVATARKEGCGCG